LRGLPGPRFFWGDDGDENSFFEERDDDDPVGIDSKTYSDGGAAAIIFAGNDFGLGDGESLSDDGHDDSLSSMITVPLVNVICKRRPSWLQANDPDCKV